MLEKEFEKAHILKKYNLNDILLTQLLPFINNMKELGIDIRIIIKIMDEFLLKYNYLSKESYNVLFSILDNNPKQIEKYRKELKDNPNLENELYNNDKKNDNDDNKANDNDSSISSIKDMKDNNPPTQKTNKILYIIVGVVSGIVMVTCVVLLVVLIVTKYYQLF